ncbi:hypothetical protein P4507_001548 [Enterococcus faecalis]|nr:hypothetical protein [Enterococcus faecalis]
MTTELDRVFQQKEEQYLIEKRQIEDRLEKVMAEKRAFHRYLDQLANQVNYPTPYYDEVPNKQVVYRLLTNSQEIADRRIRQEQLRLESELEEKQLKFREERNAYENTKRNGDSEG